MFGLEGGSQYNQAMEVAVDELGLDPEEARYAAAMTAVIYGSFSSFLESIQFNSVIRATGFSKRADKIFMSNIMNYINKQVPKDLSKAARGRFWRDMATGVVDAGTFITENSFVEGWQQLASEISLDAVERGYGTNPEEAIGQLFQNLPSEIWDHAYNKKGIIPIISDDPEVRQAFWQGLTGIGPLSAGKVFGFTKRAQKRFQEAIELGDTENFINVKVENTTVTVTNPKTGEIEGVWEAGSFDEATQAI
jgi:hypothetical protein